MKVNRGIDIVLPSNTSLQYFAWHRYFIGSQRRRIASTCRCHINSAPVENT